MTKITKLKNINIFQSEEQYLENETSLNAADISLIPCSNGLPIGFEYFQMNPNVQAGSLPLIGGTYDRTLYADFWNWIQAQSTYLITEEEWQEKAIANDGNVPFYSSGDGSTTFRVPSLACWVKGANGIEEVGSYLSDMLGSHRHGANKPSGATVDDVWCFQTIRNLSSESTARQTVAKDSSGTIYINGANKNATDFDTVDDVSYNQYTAYAGGEETRPKSIVGIYCVVAFNNCFTSGSVNLDTMRDLLSETQETILSIPTYSEATTSAAGLMSAADKTKLDRITANAAYQIPYATCSTALATAAKVATISNGVSFSLGAGAIVAIKFTNGILGNPTNLTTLNVNSTGAKTVKYYSSSNTTSSNNIKDSLFVFVYDGTYWWVTNTYMYTTVGGGTA